MKTTLNVDSGHVTDDVPELYLQGYGCQDEPTDTRKAYED